MKDSTEVAENPLAGEVDGESSEQASESDTAPSQWGEVPRWFDRPALQHLDNPAVVIIVTAAIALPDTLVHGSMALKAFGMHKVDDRPHILHCMMAVICGWLLPSTFTALRGAMRPATGHLAVLAPPGARLPAETLQSLRRWRRICVGITFFFAGPAVCFLLVMGAVLTAVMALVAMPVIDLFSLHVAGAVVEAKIHAAREGLRGAASYTSAEWVTKVHQPIIEVATVALPALSAWGPSLGLAFVGLGGYGLANINIGVVELNSVALFFGCAMIVFPLSVLLVPTGVSSECDKLQADLNGLRKDPQLSADASMRLDNLETFLLRSVQYFKLHCV